MGWRMRFSQDALVQMDWITPEESAHLNRYFVAFDPISGLVTTANPSAAHVFATVEEAEIMWHSTADPATAQFEFYDPEAGEGNVIEEGEEYKPLKRYSIALEEV